MSKREKHLLMGFIVVILSTISIVICMIVFNVCDSIYYTVRQDSSLLQDFLTSSNSLERFFAKCDFYNIRTAAFIIGGISFFGIVTPIYMGVKYIQKFLQHEKKMRKIRS
jgi:uncharacterized membrane protein SpoIIM required for sporulation